MGTASGTVSQGKTSAPQIGFTKCSVIGEMKKHTAAISIGSLPLLTYPRGNVLLHSNKIHFFHKQMITMKTNAWRKTYQIINISLLKAKVLVKDFCALERSLLKAR